MTKEVVKKKDPLTCDDCKVKKDDAVETICPHQHDVYGATVKATLCGDCYHEHERCMEI